MITTKYRILMMLNDPKLDEEVHDQWGQSGREALDYIIKQIQENIFDD